MKYGTIDNFMDFRLFVMVDSIFAGYVLYIP